jgi:plasmid stability protein
MAQVLIRDLDDDTLKQLKEQAARNHRSLQGELHAIVTRAAAFEKGREAIMKKLEARSPPAQYTDSTLLIREHRDGVRNDLIPGNGTRRGKAYPTGSVWNWLKRRPGGDLSKEEIDEYIRAERESWGLS